MSPASWADGFIDLLLPSGCLVCGSWIPRGSRCGLMCGTCRTRLPQAPWPRCPRCHHPSGTGRSSAPECRACRAWPPELASARWAWLLAPPADALVHALKYGGWAELAPEMAGDMARAAAARGAGREPTVIVPVPTTRARVRQRGYNQARLLAEALGERTGDRVVDALSRTRGGATQVALHPSQRRANVRGVFAAREEQIPHVRGANVVLVDDVLTTGATAGAAAMELARAGAAEVTLLTFARALPSLRKPGQ